jgi:FixJ family two-component response regulator
MTLPRVPVISIVDDDAPVRMATNRLVQSLGYVTHTFASGEEFLRSPEAGQTSCLIADIQMPGMSGLELQALLLNEGRRLPIIFITAFPDETLRSRALDRGAVCFLTKPFEGSALIRHLETALHRTGGESHR